MTTRPTQPRKLTEPVPRDEAEAARFHACEVFTALVHRIPGGAKVLGREGALRASRIQRYLSSPTGDDWQRLAVLGGQREGVARFLAAESTRLGVVPVAPGLPEAPVDLAQAVSAWNAFVVASLEAEQDQSRAPVLIEAGLTTITALRRLVESTHVRAHGLVRHRGTYRRASDRRPLLRPA